MNLRLASMVAALLVMLAVIFMEGNNDQTTENGTVANDIVVPPPPPEPPLPPPPPMETVSFKVPEGEIMLQKGTPLFRDPAEGSEPSLKVENYAAADELVQVLGTDDVWVKADHEGYGWSWIPAWYLSESSKEMTGVPVMQITVKEGTSHSLYPDSEWKREVLPASRSLYAAYQWRDWQGVIVPPDPWYDENKVNLPSLLWVPTSEVVTQTRVNAEELPAADLRHLSEVLLTEHVDSSYVEGLHGKPHFIERSRSLNSTGDPLQTGELWRYEEPEAHFEVTFIDRKLKDWKWILPMTSWEQKSLNQYDYWQPQNYYFSELPLAPTEEMDWVWRNEGSLAYTYLIDATKDVLLVIGDDGGFSGMHYDSSLYAVNRHTGETLWQVDAGWGWTRSILDEAGENVIVHTQFDPATKESRDLLERRRMSDGEVLWSYGDVRHMWMSGAKGVIVLHNELYPEMDAGLKVLDAVTGEVLWERTFKENVTILNRTGHEPYILLQQDMKLTALDPRTGDIRWIVTSTEEVPEGGPAGTLLEAKRGPFAEEQPNRWFRLGNELLLINISSSKVGARYSPGEHESIRMIDDRYFLIVASLDDPWFHQGTKFETTLYDAVAGKTLWAIPGEGGFSPMLAGDTLYFSLDGLPTAVDWKTGKLLWQTPATVHGVDPKLRLGGNAYLDEPLLFSDGDDLLHINKKDGSVIGRLQDVLIGFPDGREKVLWDGLVNRDGDEIYLGSANGYFSRWK